MISYLSNSFYGKPYKALPNEDKDEDDDKYELSDKSKSVNRFSPQSLKYKNEEIYVITIKEGQSLQAIALKYNCTLWELNRLNNLLSTQDFYSLKEIKIPSTKNSYRSELLKSDGGQLLSEKITIENGVIDQEPKSNIFNDNGLNHGISNYDYPKSSVDLILDSPSFDANEFIVSQSKKQAQNFLFNFKLVQIICILLICLVLLPTIIIIGFLYTRKK